MPARQNGALVGTDDRRAMVIASMESPDESSRQRFMQQPQDVSHRVTLRLARRVEVDHSWERVEALREGGHHVRRAFRFAEELKAEDVSTAAHRRHDSRGAQNADRVVVATVGALPRLALLDLGRLVAARCPLLCCPLPLLNGRLVIQVCPQHLATRPHLACPHLFGLLLHALHGVDATLEVAHGIVDADETQPRLVLPRTRHSPLITLQLGVRRCFLRPKVERLSVRALTK